MLDINARADKSDLDSLTSIILEVLNLDAVEAGIEIQPFFVDTATVPVDVKDEFTVKVQFGSIIGSKGKLVKTGLLNLHEGIVNETEMILPLLGGSGEERSYAPGCHRACKNFLYAHERAFMIGVLNPMSLRFYFKGFEGS